MTDLLASRFRHLFEYEMDSHAKVLDALEAASAAAREKPEFQQAVDLLAHVIAARRMWLARLEGTPMPGEGFFPKGLRLEDLPARQAAMSEAWQVYLNAADDDEIQRVFEYRSLDAGGFRNAVEDTLHQLHGHSLYHRGQIASRLRSIGCQPAVTDYIYWARRPVG